MNKLARNIWQFEQFRCYLDNSKPLLKQQYRQRLAEDLSRQQWHECFQRNVLAVLANFYNDAEQQLRSLRFDTGPYRIENGMSKLTRTALTCFQGYSDEFLLFAVEQHRTSCALSNFPDEHKPDQDYINHVKREIAKLWQAFALHTNAYFLELS